MVDRCVMCGEIIPEGSHTCKKCENLITNELVCQECGSALTLMNVHWYNTCAGHACSAVFHCRNCHADLERIEEYVAQPVKFTRKFWG